jgi:hypothetical protein
VDVILHGRHFDMEPHRDLLIVVDQQSRPTSVRVPLPD